VQIPDDDQFKDYLKRFQPVEPDSIPARDVSTARRWPTLAMRFAAAAAIVLIAVLVLYLRSKRVAPTTAHDMPSPEQHTAVAPLTMRSANALLTKGQPFNAVVDDLAFRPRTDPVPQGQQSALAVLSKEKTKL
jgi:hypothetical protein